MRSEKMDSFDVTHVGAALAGLLSFVSPCILPLVPAYLCFLGGTSLDRLAAEGGPDPALARRVLGSALAFVFGFATVFVILGATATTLSRAVAGQIAILSQIAGIVIIVFGLHFMGVFRIGFLNFEKRFHLESKPSGPVGSYLLGLAFAFGWTPCVGPILAAILVVAASEPTAGRGASLLAAYAAGMGLPFLIAAIAVRPFMAFMARFRRHMRAIEIAIGVLLVATGVAIATGRMAEAAFWLLQTFPIFSRIG